MLDEFVYARELKFELFISEAAIQRRIEVLAQQIVERYKDQCPIFLGVLNGAFIFAADLIRACSFACETSFIKLSSYKGLKSSGQVAAVIGLELDIKGRHIILVEDIIDTGNTMHSFLPELLALEPASISLASLLVKREAMEYDIEIDYVGFEIPNRFVIGYGLDYDGEGRNFRAIYQLVERGGGRL